jgi:hypothetical protein
MVPALVGLTLGSRVLAQASIPEEGIVNPHTSRKLGNYNVDSSTEVPTGIHILHTVLRAYIYHGSAPVPTALQKIEQVLI